jgi:hypothetical protein
MRKYTKGQEVVVLHRRRWDDEDPTVLKGTMVSGGSKNVTIEFTEDGQTRRETFELEHGTQAGYSYGRYPYRFMMPGDYAREQAAEEIEGNFEISEVKSVRTQIIAVSVQNRDSLWFELIGCEFEPRMVRLTFSQFNGGSIQLDAIELSGPKLNEDTLKVDGGREVAITRRPECYRADLREEDKIGNVYSNSLPKWAWAVAEKVWPNVSTL